MRVDDDDDADDGGGNGRVDGVGAQPTEESVNSPEEGVRGLPSTYPSDFEEIWQTYIGSGGFDVTGWEEFFDELEP